MPIGMVLEWNFLRELDNHNYDYLPIRTILEYTIRGWSGILSKYEYSLYSSWWHMECFN